jgi:hypothetical protein
MIDSLPTDVRARIDRYLDAVDTQLSATGMTRQQRRAVTDDLETQILDMLASAQKQPPAVTDVEEIIARMDRPEAYAEARPNAQPSPAVSAAARRAGLNSDAKWGAAFIGLAVASQLLVFEAVRLLVLPVIRALNGGDGEVPAPPALTQWVAVTLAAVAIPSVVVATIGPIVGTVCGWLATRRIRQSGRTETGLGLAVLVAVFYPLLAIWGGTFVFRNWVVRTNWPPGDLAPDRLAIAYVTLSFVVGAALLSATYLWVLWRLTEHAQWTASASSGSRGYHTPMLARLLPSRR